MYSSINFDKFIKPYNLTIIKIKKYFYHQKNKYISPLFSLHNQSPSLAAGHKQPLIYFLLSQIRISFSRISCKWLLYNTLFRFM